MMKKAFKMLQNAFYFILKVLFVLKIFKFLSSLFGQVRNIYDVKTWLTNNWNTHMAQYLTTMK